MNVGHHERPLHGDYTLAVDFTDLGLYAEDPITTATLTATGDSALTVGTPDVATEENVVLFRVSGGTVNARATVTVEVANALGDDYCVTLAVVTRRC